MNTSKATLYIVDDDSSIRRSLTRLFAALGYNVASFASAAEFLDIAPNDEQPSCVILDLQMPVLDGFDVQAGLLKRHIEIPVVFLTGHGDISTSVQALKAGASDFVTKPVDAQVLIAVVAEALRKDEQPRLMRAECREIQAKLALLTNRERDVFEHVIGGLLNKQIANRLGIAEKTVKVHRGRVMDKMQANSVADLVRMAERAGISARL